MTFDIATIDFGQIIAKIRRRRKHLRKERGCDIDVSDVFQVAKEHAPKGSDDQLKLVELIYKLYPALPPRNTVSQGRMACELTWPKKMKMKMRERHDQL